MTKGLAVALAPQVRVNCVAPAFTDTPWMSEHFGAEYQALSPKLPRAFLCSVSLLPTKSPEQFSA